MAELSTTPAPAAPAPSTSTPASTPATTTATPSAGPAKTDATSFRGQSYDKVFEKFDEVSAAGEAGDETPEPIPEQKIGEVETEPEKVTEDPQKEVELSEELSSYGLSLQQVKDGLKQVGDPKVRAAFQQAYHLVRDYQRCGVPIGDFKQMVQIVPSLEAARKLDARVNDYDALESAYVAGTPQAAVAVLKTMEQASPHAFSQVVDVVVDNLQQINPRALDRLGARILRNVVANMKRSAQKNDDLLLADHAEGMAAYLGFVKPDEEAAAQPALTPQQQRALQEAEAIKAEQAQRQASEFQQRYQSFQQNAVNVARSALAKEAEAWIRENASEYPDTAKATLYDRLGPVMSDAMFNNPTIAKNFQRMVDDGYGDEAHMNQVVAFLKKQGEILLPLLAQPILNEYAAVRGPRQQQREEQLKKHVERRDVGAAGAPPTSVPRISGRTKEGKPRSMDAVFDDFEALHP